MTIYNQMMASMLAIQLEEQLAAKKTVRPLMKVEEAKAELASKGWTNRALAEWWACSEEYVSKIVNNLERRRWFDDAIRGLPHFAEASTKKKKKVEQ